MRRSAIVIALTWGVNVVGALSPGAEEPENNQKLRASMGWQVGKWECQEITNSRESRFQLADMKSYYSTKWALNGQILTGHLMAQWNASQGTLERQYTYYWDRRDKKLKVVWFSSWGTSTHGVLKKSASNSLTWEWSFQDSDGTKGTNTTVQTLRDDGTMTVEGKRTSENGDLVDDFTAVYKRVNDK